MQSWWGSRFLAFQYLLGRRWRGLWECKDESNGQDSTFEVSFRAVGEKSSNRERLRASRGQKVHFLGMLGCGQGAEGEPPAGREPAYLFRSQSNQC